MAGIVSRMMGLLRADAAFPAAQLLESSTIDERLSSYAYYLLHTAGAPVDISRPEPGSDRELGRTTS